MKINHLIIELNNHMYRLLVETPKKKKEKKLHHHEYCCAKIQNDSYIIYIGQQL